MISKRSLRATLIMGLVLGFCSRIQAESVCDIRPATAWYTTISAGNYRLLFDDDYGPAPAGDNHPRHGYIFTTNSDSFRIAGPGGTCSPSYEVGIVTMPVFVGNARYLYIPTYSGSDEYLFMLDARSCKTLWRSPDLDGPPVRVAEGYLLPGIGRAIIEKNCRPRLVSR